MGDVKNSQPRTHVPPYCQGTSEQLEDVSSDCKASINSPAIQTDINSWLDDWLGSSSFTSHEFRPFGRGKLPQVWGAYDHHSYLGVGFKKLYIVFNPVPLKRNDHYFAGIWFQNGVET